MKILVILLSCLLWACGDKAAHPPQEAAPHVAATQFKNLTELQQAAQAGNAEAQYALAVMLRTGRGRAVDLPQSALWLAKAAAQGHPAAQAAQASGRAQAD